MTAEPIDEDLRGGLTAAERTLRAQKAANARWSRPGARQRQSRVIRDSRLRYYELQVDPDGQLDPAERARLAQNALNADMAGLALKASRARRAAAARRSTEAT